MNIARSDGEARVPAFEDEEEAVVVQFFLVILIFEEIVLPISVLFLLPLSLFGHVAYSTTPTPQANMDFVCFRHQGILCALPADQARSAEASRTELRQATLWKARQAPEGDRFLRVELPEGPRSVRCSDLRVQVLSSKRRVRLPPLVRSAIALPHVVGLLRVNDNGMAWLLDLADYRAAHGIPRPKGRSE